MGIYTRAVSGQQLGKQFSAANNRRAIIEALLEKECFHMFRAEEI
jgi:hypothetical protein